MEGDPIRNLGGMEVNPLCPFSRSQHRKGLFKAFGNQLLVKTTVESCHHL